MPSSLWTVFLGGQDSISGKRKILNKTKNEVFPGHHYFVQIDQCFFWPSCVQCLCTETDTRVKDAMTTLRREKVQQPALRKCTDNAES